MRKMRSAINDDVTVHCAQVHGTNNGREISDGISRAAMSCIVKRNRVLQAARLTLAS
jgi:hypothetical protein